MSLMQKTASGLAPVTSSLPAYLSVLELNAMYARHGAQGRTDLALGTAATESAAALRDRSTHTGQQASTTISDLAEAVQDIVGAMVVSGANVTLSYDDSGTGQLTVNAVGGGDAEVMRDTIGAALVGINGVSVAVNDSADTITLSISGVTINQVAGLQAALDAKAPTANPTFTGTVSGINMSMISGRGSLDNMTPQSTAIIDWNGTNWQYDGVNVSARPTSSNRVRFILYDPIGSATPPSWALDTVDLLLQKVTP